MQLARIKCSFHSEKGESKQHHEIDISEKRWPQPHGCSVRNTDSCFKLEAK